MRIIFLMLLFFAGSVHAMHLLTPPYDFYPLDPDSTTADDDGLHLTNLQAFQTYQALKDANAASGYSNIGMAECSRTAHDINDYNNLCYLSNTGNAILGTYNAYPLNQNYSMTGLHNSHVRDILSWLTANSPAENPHKLYVISIIAIKDMTLWHLNYSELLAADYYLQCNDGTKILIYQSRGYHGASQTYADKSTGKSLACPTGVAPPDRVPVNLLPKPPSTDGTNTNSGGAANSGASGTSGLAATGIANDAESATDAAVVAEIRAVDQNLPLLNVLTTIKDMARKSPSCAFGAGCYSCLDYVEDFYRTSGGSVLSYQSNIFSCLDMAFAATKSKATTYYPSSGTPNPAAKPTDYLKNTGTASAADNASDKYALSLLDNASTALVARDAAKQSASCEASDVCKSCVADAPSVSAVKKCVTDAMAASKSALPPSSGSGTGSTGTGSTGTGSTGTGTGAGSTGTGTGASSGNCSPAGTGASGTGTPAKGTVCLSFEDAINQCYGLDSLGNSLGAGNKWSDTLAAYADAKCVDLPSDKPAAGKREGNIAFFYNGEFAYKASGGGIWSYSCPADVPAKPSPRDPKTGKPIDPCASPTAGSSGAGNGSGNGATSSDIKGLQDATTKGLGDVGTKIDGTNKLLTSSNTKLDTIASNTGTTAKNTEAINKGIDKLVAGQCGGKNQPACKIDVGSVPTASSPVKDAACKTAECYGAQIDHITGDISKALFPQGTPLTCATPACVSARLDILDTEVQFCYDMLGQILTILGTIFKLLAYFYAIRILLT